MQVNGTGNRHEHSMHQVTNCIHTQGVSKKETGAVTSSIGSTQQVESTIVQQTKGQFSLAAWLRDCLSGGKKLLQKIWGDSADGAQAVKSAGDNVLQTEGQVMTQLGDASEGREMIASAAIRQPIQENNPYFSAIEDTGREKQNIWEKVKVRFHAIAGQLMGRFSAQNSFQAKQEKPKEDLRRHSRYREDDLEIDCILTDDSYLLDSYDRKGEYSKLSTKK